MMVLLLMSSINLYCSLNFDVNIVMPFISVDYHKIFDWLTRLGNLKILYFVEYLKCCYFTVSIAASHFFSFLYDGAGSLLASGVLIFQTGIWFNLFCDFWFLDRHLCNWLYRMFDPRNKSQYIGGQKEKFVRYGL